MSYIAILVHSIELNLIDDDDKDEECHILQDLCIQVIISQRNKNQKISVYQGTQNTTCELCNDLHSCKFLFPLR